MMKWVTISDHTARGIADCAIPGLPFRNTSRRNADGTLEIPLSDEVIARLDELRQAGEDDDTVISRLIAGFRNRLQ